MNISIDNLNVFQRGIYSDAFVLNSNGDASQLNPYKYASAKSILDQTYSNIMSESFRSDTSRALDLSSGYSAALSPAQSAHFTSAIPTAQNGNYSNPLSKALRGVAKSIIFNRGTNLQRQIFFVQLGGFDFHDAVLNQPRCQNEGCFERNVRVLGLPEVREHHQ